MATLLDHTEMGRLGYPGWPYGLSDKVRFAELDALNHVNNVVFFTWFENVRIPYMVARGLTGYSHGPDDPQLVVRHQWADYLVPMHRGEDYIVTARTKILKPTSFVMEHAVIVNGDIRARGEVVMISLSHDGTTRREHKPAAMEALKSLDKPELG